MLGASRYDGRAYQPENPMWVKFLRSLLIFTIILLSVVFVSNRSQQGDMAMCPRVDFNPPSDPNAIRGELYLNGTWQFLPVARATDQTGDWGEILVPGDWQRDTYYYTAGVQKRGKSWANTNLEQFNLAWYQRRVQIPDWGDRRILLDIGRVSTDARIYINNLQCGEVQWPSGTIDITKLAPANSTIDLRILVASVSNERERTVVMGPNQVITKPASFDAKGLVGDIRLLSLPKGPYIQDVAIQTSTRDRQIKLQVALGELSQAGPVQFQAQMLRENGELEIEFKSTVNTTPGKTVELVWDWPAPRLWDVGQPNLYNLQLVAKGQGLDDLYNQSFGFREFWIEGRRFFLNGQEIRLRPVLHEDQWQGWAMGVPEVIAQSLQAYSRAGFNIAEIWPWNRDERGRWHFQDLVATIADRQGFPLMMPALDMVNYADVRAWPRQRATWEAKMRRDLRRDRNHPSVLIWATSPNYFGHGDDQNPRRIGKKNVVGTLPKNWRNQTWQEAAKVGEEAVALIKKYDPTRPVLVHQGAAVGDIYALNSYLNMIPLQEREEWLSHWAEQGDMPYMVVEFGTPLHATMMRDRNGFAGAIHSEPLMSEYTAIYLGSKAYDLETRAYRDRIQERFLGGRSYKSWHLNQELDFAPAFQQLQSLFSTNTWRSWRTQGISGGMIPWNDGHGWQITNTGKELKPQTPTPGQRGVYLPYIQRKFWEEYQGPSYRIQPGGQAILDNNAPTLAWIAGAAPQFTTKDHNFWSREQLQKQIVLINDTRQIQPYQLSWQAQLEDRVIASGQRTGQIEPARTEFFPLAVELPTITGKQNGQITLQARIGNANHKDSFKFRVFARPDNSSGMIALVGPSGATGQMLQALGYQVTTWNGGDAPLVAIGRNTLEPEQPLPENLRNYLRQGGRVIVFGQTRLWYTRRGWRIARPLSRRVFPVQADHPVVAGLDAEDLRDWRGASSLSEAYPDTVAKPVPFGPYGSPWYGWRWSNQGALSSVAIEKPHRSGWRPILESEFDLAYSPLMELDYGRGRLIITTLDLEDHYSQDAAAAQLTKQLLDYAANAPLTGQLDKLAVIGQAHLLDNSGVNYQVVTDLTTAYPVTVVGQGSNLSDRQIQNYLNQGGKLLFLTQNRETSNLGLQLQWRDDFPGSLQVPDWPETRGLSSSDLHARTNFGSWTIVSGGDIAANGLFSRLQQGSGVALFTEVNPFGLKADERTYLRLTRWRQTRALSQVLANLGGRFSADENIWLKSPQANFYHPDYWREFEYGDDPYRYYRW